MVPTPATATTDDRILDAAMRVFTEVGLRGATTRRIAEEAGVNEVTLFRRFGTKEQLLIAATARHRELGGNVLPEAPIDPAAELDHWVRTHADRLHRVRLLIRSSLTEIEAHPELCAATHEGPRQVQAQLAGYIERLQRASLADPDVDPQAAATLLMGALFAEVVARPVMPEARPPAPEELSHRYVPLFLRAIGARPVPAPDPADPTRGTR